MTDLSRRRLLVGTGVLLTTAFIAEARAAFAQTGRLLLPQPQQAEIEIFVHLRERGWITVGPDLMTHPDPPTWRDYLTGYRRMASTEPDEVFAEAAEVEAEQVDDTMRAREWEHVWRGELCPEAQAYQLLSKLDLGAHILREELLEDFWEPELEAVTFYPEGQYLGDSSKLVRIEHPVTASLLQARLIDLGMRVAVKQA
ncbi:hypothetical protein [Alsobacter sp. R-9]